MKQLYGGDFDLVQATAAREPAQQVFGLKELRPLVRGPSLTQMERWTAKGSIPVRRREAARKALEARIAALQEMKEQTEWALKSFEQQPILEKLHQALAEDYTLRARVTGSQTFDGFYDALKKSKHPAAQAVAHELSAIDARSMARRDFDAALERFNALRRSPVATKSSQLALITTVSGVIGVCSGLTASFPAGLILSRNQAAREWLNSTPGLAISMAIAALGGTAVGAAIPPAVWAARRMTLDSALKKMGLRERGSRVVVREFQIGGLLTQKEIASNLAAVSKALARHEAVKSRLSS